MAETKIEWVTGPDGSRGRTVNPIRFRNLETGKIGHYCEKISPGCANCYASTMQKPYLSGLGYVAGNREKGELFLDDAVLDSVLRRRTPTGYFWCDMTDLFGSWVPDGWIVRCLLTMARTPQHRHYVLTKRGDRMLSVLEKWADLSGESNDFRNARGPEATRSAHPSGRGQLFASMLETMGSPPPGCAFPTFDWMGGPRWWPTAPLRNLWLGVSASTRRDLAAQIEHLRATPAAVRFLSLEPLLEDLGTIDLSGIGWVIVGGESGPGARPCQIEYVRSIVRQCRNVGVPCFVKQLGSVPVVRPCGQHHFDFGEGIGRKARFSAMDKLHPATENWRVHFANGKGSDPAEWPEDLRMRELPEPSKKLGQLAADKEQHDHF